MTASADSQEMNFQNCLTHLASSLNQTVSFGIQIMKHAFWMVACLASALAFAQLVGAAEPLKEPAPVKETAAAKSQSPVERAVRKAAANFDQAFNSGNADKIASLWTSDAEYIDEDGERYAGAT